MIHLDYRPVKGCTNPDTYGEICVKCNDCGRLNHTCLNCGKVAYPKGWGQVELIDSFRESICDDCLPLFSEDELNPSLPKTIWVRKKDFKPRKEKPIP